MTKPSKYNKEEIIKKLESKGLEAKYYDGLLSHFEEKRFDVALGIKMLGYLDFLNVPVIKKIKKEKMK